MHQEEQAPECDQAQFNQQFAAWAMSELWTDAWRVWVAESSPGSLVGHVYVRIVGKVPRPGEIGRWGYMTAFFVAPESRNAGVGKELLAAAINWGRQSGLEFIEVWPSARAIPLYNRIGFAADSEAHHLPITE